MTTINDLVVSNSFSDDDKFPMWSNANGVTRSLPISALTAAFLTQDDIALLAASTSVEVFTAGVDFIPGVSLTLPLAHVYASAQNIVVHFDTLYQGPDQFSLVLQTLTFSSPIPVGVSKVYVSGGAIRVIGAPSDGTVTASTIAPGSVTAPAIGPGAVTAIALAAGAVGDVAISAASHLYNRIHDIVSVKDFGAKGDGATDDTVAIQAARDFIAANATRFKLIFPSGIYLYSASPNWAIQNAQIEALGEVRLRYTGTGVAVVLDAGSGSQVCYNVKMGRFIVECPSTALDAVFVRSVHHSNLGFDVRGAGAASSGLHVQFAVCTLFDNFTCSVNEEGWYLGAKPLQGINLDIRNAGETASYCTFINPVVEGPSTGVLLTSTLGNLFIGGTFEGCTVQGALATAGAAEDRFIGTDFEANGIGGPPVDIFIQGKGIELFSCDTFSRIEFGSTSRSCAVINGQHSNIAFDPGSKGNSAINVKYNRFGNGSTFLDAGTLNQAVGVQDGSTNFGYLTGATAFTPGTITNGASNAAVFSVTGTQLGMPAIGSFSLDLQGVSISAYVPSANNIAVIFANNTGSSKTIAAGTVFAQALKIGA